MNEGDVPVAVHRRVGVRHTRERSEGEAIPVRTVRIAPDRSQRRRGIES